MQKSSQPNKEALSKFDQILESCSDFSVPLVYIHSDTHSVCMYADMFTQKYMEDIIYKFISQTYSG